MTRSAITNTAIVALLTTLAVASTSQADYMTYNGQPLKRSVTIHDPSVGILNTNAGQFSITYKGVDRFAYCTEITQTAGSMEATELPINTLPNYELVAYLMEQVAPANTNDLAAAIQIALWEAIFEVGVLDATSGSFWIEEAGIAGGANTLISSFPGSYTPTAAFRLTNPTRQDMLIVPEPVTLSTLGIGALGVILKRRNRK